MSKRSTLALAGIIAATLIVSSIPYLFAYVRTPPGMRFMGIVANVNDWTQYLAWMKALTHNVIVENPLTPELQKPSFFNLQWLVLGRIQLLIGTGYQPVIQVFRLVVVAVFMAVTFRLCNAYFAGHTVKTWCAWLLVNFSSGFGWLTVAVKQFTGVMKNPNDVYVTEPVSFQNMIALPHFLAAAVLIFVALACVALAIERKNIAWAAAGAVVSLVLGVTHAYDLFIVYSVVAVFLLLVIVREGFSWFTVGVGLLVFGLSVPPAAYFFALTNTDPVWKAVLEQFKNVGVFTPTPLNLVILLGLPFLLAAATFGGVWSDKPLSQWQRLVRVWLLVNFFVLYIPTDYQIHMLNGWQVPLSLLAIEGLFDILLPALRRFSWIQKLGADWAARLRLPGAAALAGALIIVASLPTNIYLTIWRSMVLARPNHTFYLYEDELQVTDWLEKNTQPSEIVLSDLTLGQYIPALSGNHVYLGHWAQTVDFYKKQENVAKIFKRATPDSERQTLLKEFNVRYLVYGREERALGDLDPATLPYMQLAYETPETKLYRLSLTP